MRFFNNKLVLSFKYKNPSSVVPIIQKPKFIKEDLVYTTNSLIKYHFQNNNFEKAIEVFQMFDKLKIKDDKIIDTVIMGCVKCSKVGQGFELFNQRIGNNSFTPSLYTYTNLIHGCSKLEEYKKMKELFDHMLAKEIRPNVYTITTMIKGLMTHEETSEVAEYIYSKMHDLKIKPNIYAIGSMLEGYFNHEKVEKFMETIMDLNKYQISPNPFIYQLMIKGFVKWKEYDKIREFIGVFFKNESSNHLKLRVLNILINETFKLRNVENINYSIETLNLYSIQPDVITYNTIMSGYLRIQEYDKILHYFEQMKRKNIEPNVQTYTILLEKIFNSNEGSDFNDILDTILKKVSTNMIDRKLLLKILKCSIKFNEKPEIILEYPIYSSFLDFEFYSLILEQYKFIQENLDRILEIKRKMTAKDIYPNIKYYLQLMRFLFHFKKIDVIEQCLIEIDHNLNDDFPIDYFNFLLHFYSKYENITKEEKVNKIKEIVNEIQDRNLMNQDTRKILKFIKEN
eukprot:gene11116-3935_t